MPIRFHPRLGTIVACDFGAGFKEPEMIKRRPVVVISPAISTRRGLCTVVALSTTPPRPALSYHCELSVNPPLPSPWSSETMWVKGDMVYAVAFHRLDLIRTGKDALGQRTYLDTPLPAEDIRRVRCCVLSALGLVALTRHI